MRAQAQTPYTVGSSAQTVDQIAGLLTIVGGGGSDTLTVNDTGDHFDNAGTLTETTLTGLDMPSVEDVQQVGVESGQRHLQAPHRGLRKRCRVCRQRQRDPWRGLRRAHAGLQPERRRFPVQAPGTLRLSGYQRGTGDHRAYQDLHRDLHRRAGRDRFAATGMGRNPCDHPDCVVARRHVCGRDGGDGRGRDPDTEI